MQTSDLLETTLLELMAYARLRNHRALLVVSGERDWCEQQGLRISRALAPSAEDSKPHGQLWIGEAVTDCQQSIGFKVMAAAKCVHYLGTESDLVVYNAFDGFNPDAVASISGTVVGGGLMVLLTPPLRLWPSFVDPDYQRMLVHPYDIEAIKGNFLSLITASIQTAKNVVLLDQQQGFRPLTLESNLVNTTQPHIIESECLTVDQQQAVKDIVQVVVGHRRRPLVITADRGRGKSSALGIAAATLLKQSAMDVLVTAPRFDAVLPLFRMAQTLLPGAKRDDKSICYQGSSIRFVAVDELLRTTPKASLMLVDEAAAIPAPMLEQLLVSYPRIVFSTTVHGYEGTGRGFNIRFKKILDSRAKGWRAIQLFEPIRWSDNDPLERWVFDSLLLDAEIAEDQQLAGVDANSCEFELFSPERLLAEPQILKQVFSLLVQAHYQTTPGDLRDLLDGLNLKLWVLHRQQTVVAVLLVALEGEFDETLAQCVWLGKRRPRGHLLPQMLTAQGGWLEAAGCSYLRVVRIAVHPAVQNKGFGSLMLEQLHHYGQQQAVDFIGSSFGANAELMGFWQANHFQCLWLGMTRDASSGCHSALITRPLSARAKHLQQLIRERFHSQFPAQLSGPYRDLQAELVISLLAEFDSTEKPIIDQQDELDLISYLCGNRGYEQALSALRKLLLVGLAGGDEGKQASISPGVISLILQHHSWHSCVRQSGVTGKKQMEKLVRTELAAVLARLNLSPRSTALFQQLGPQT
ncbi:MAG: GNAT family N-acetyltransferase [Motiliproteus sp.]